jgi:hypothetical protein
LPLEKEADDMRVSPFATVAVFALASCCGAGCSPRPTPADRTIGIHLYRQTNPPNKCVVSFDNVNLKDPANAVVYTGHKVIWEVTKNDCGDLKKVTKKALGLQHLNLKGQPASWIKDCNALDSVPGQFSSPPRFLCDIPKLPNEELGQYEYGIDGDDVDPSDPGLDVQRGH